MPDEFSMLLAADWLEEADFEQEKLRAVAQWLRAQTYKREYDMKLRRLAKHLGKPVPKVREIVERNAKNNNMTPQQLLDAYCEKEGIS